MLQLEACGGATWLAPQSLQVVSAAPEYLPTGHTRQPVGSSSSLFFSPAPQDRTHAEESPFGAKCVLQELQVDSEAPETWPPGQESQPSAPALFFSPAPQDRTHAEESPFGAKCVLQALQVDSETPETWPPGQESQPSTRALFFSPAPQDRTHEEESPFGS